MIQRPTMVKSFR